MAKHGKFSKEKRAKYLDNLRLGMTRSDAAQAADVHRDTVRLLRIEDAEFAGQEIQAEMDGCDPIEQVLRNKAMEGNMTAIQVWLYNRSGGRWTDKRKADINITQAPGTPQDFLDAMKGPDDAP